MPSLERRLNLFSVITISISSMIGSGIFVLPGIGFDITGPSLYLAFLLSAFCIVPAAISKGELATAMPTSGGTYVYLERTFGPLVGTVSGLGLFLSILLKAAFSLVGIAAYFQVFSSFPLAPTVISFLVVIVALNIFGIGKVSSFLTAILFVTLIGLVVLCFLAIPHWDAQNIMTNPMPNGFSGFASATALVFVSFAGVTKIAAIAEEIKEPEKNIPKGIMISLVLVTIVYCTISFVLAGVYSHTEIAGEIKPIYVLAKQIGGPAVGAIYAVIATLTMVNTSNAGILAGSRFPFAMSRDQLIPKIFGKLHKTFLTPIISILLSGAIVAFVLMSFDVAKIAKLASAFMILGYIMVNITVIVLRESRTQWYKPGYKSFLYPFLQIFGIVSGILLLVSMGKLALFAILTIAIPGVFLYLFYSKNRTDRKGVIGIRGKRRDLIYKDPVYDESFCRFNLEGDAQIVVGLFGREKSAEMLIEMGLAMAEHTHVEVASIMEIPEQTDLHDVIEEPNHLKSLRRRVIAMANEKNESITFDPIVSHDVSKTVFEISQGLHCKWLLIEWAGKTTGRFTFHSPIGWLKSHLHCHLATFRDSGVRYIRKIMVLINNDKNDKLTLEIADHLAKVFWADITLMRHASSKDSPEKINFEKTYLKDLGSKLESQTHQKVIIGDDKLSLFVNQTADYDLLILGSTDHTIMNSMFGTFDDKLISKAYCSVLAVHAGKNI